jgi:hypothetical protein
MNQVSSRVDQNALMDLKDAFNRYCSSKCAHPTFASRRDGQSFTVDSSNPKVVMNAGNTIKIPTVGTFPGHEPLECGLVSQTFTLSKEGSRWFVSFCVDAERLEVQQTHCAKRTRTIVWLHTDIAQQTLKVVDRTFHTFYALISAVKSGSYQPKVRLPHYLPKDGYFVLIIPRIVVKDGRFNVPMSNALLKLFGAGSIPFPLETKS